MPGFPLKSQTFDGQLSNYSLLLLGKEPVCLTCDMPGPKALIAIETLAVFRGSPSTRTLALVTEWATLHRAELMEDWALAREEA